MENKAQGENLVLTILTVWALSLLVPFKSAIFILDQRVSDTMLSSSQKKKKLITRNYLRKEQKAMHYSTVCPCGVPVSQQVL